MLRIGSYNAIRWGGNLPRIVGVRREIIEQLIISHQLHIFSDYDYTSSNTVLFGDRVALHRDHHYALLSWARAVGIMFRPGVELVHLDLHPDLDRPFIPLPRELEGCADKMDDTRLNQVADFLNASDDYPDSLPEERFIVPAFKMGMFGKYIHVIPGETPCGNPEAMGFSAETVLLKDFFARVMHSPKTEYVLDIDLDFFCLPTSQEQRAKFPYSRAGNLQEDLDMLIAIIKNHPPAFVSVAISPASVGRLTLTRYNSLTPSEISMILFRIIETLGMQGAAVNLLPEPRRVTRASFK